MRLNARDIARYPKFAYYIKHDLPKIITVPSIVNGMKNIAQLKKAKLRAALTWGVEPQIKITSLTGAYGEFTPNTGSNEIRINTSLVNDFENGHGKRLARAGNVYLVGVTLLHELVHWGDDQDRIDRPGEEGAEFEKSIYGSVID